MPIRGSFFDGRSSRARAAQLRASGGHLGVFAEDGAPLTKMLPVAELKISSRIGDTPRYIRFPDGGQFETRDHETLERELAQHRGHPGLAHLLESRWRYLPPALAIVIGFVWWAVAVGVPWSAKVLAFSLPQESSQWIEQGTLHFLDRHVLAPSTLPEARRVHLQQRFANFIQPWQDGQSLKVLFRSGADTIEANALALPSGTIVFTDELVRLAEHDEELLAVLAHEVGHVRERHSLRQGLQDSALTLVLVAVVGDVSALTSLAGSMPLVLTQMGYSRAFEREADDFAVQALQQQGVEVRHLANILRRLAQSHCDEDADPEACMDSDQDWRGYWSTHPGTRERIERLHRSVVP